MLNEKPSPNLVETLKTQDEVALMDFWRQSAELQEEISANLYYLVDPQKGLKFLEFLKSRYEKAPTWEKENIFIGLENITFANMAVLSPTVDYLTQNFDQFEDKTLLATKCLKKIELHSFLTLESSTEENQKVIQENLAKILDRELTTIEGEYPDEVKMEAMRGIYRQKKSPQKERLVKDLKGFIQGEDKEMSSFALGELYGIYKPSDPYIVENLAKELENFDPAKDRQKTLIRIVMAQKTENPRLLSFLENWQSQNLFPDDFQYNQYLDEAIKTLEVKNEQN